MSFQARRLRVQLPCGEGTVIEQAAPGPVGGGCGAITACRIQSPIACANSCQFPTVDCAGGTCWFQSQGACPGFNTNCGFASPCQGFASPCQGFNSPCPGLNTNCGFASPCQGFASPCQGFNSPCPGFNTNCGFASPCQAFASPCQGASPCDPGSACGPQSICGPGSACGPGTPVGCPGGSRDIAVNPERFVVDPEVLPTLRAQLEAQLQEVEIAEQALRDLESEQ